MSGDSFTNVARDRACVGAQIGKQVGDTHVDLSIARDGDDNPDRSARVAAVETGLAAVREELTQLYKQGQLGEQVYASATDGLQEAESLAGQEAGKRTRLIAILQRVERVLANVADLGSKIASILDAVHHL